MSTPAPAKAKQAPTIKDFLLARRRVKELPEGTPVREGVAATRCQESGCGSAGACACQFKLGGKKEGAECGRAICLEHSGLNDPGRKKGDPVYCGPHRRHPTVGVRGR